MSVKKSQFENVAALIAEPVATVRDFAAKCIECKLATRVDEQCGRVILSVNRKFCNIAEPLYRECNGIVIAFDAITAATAGDSAGDSASDDANVSAVAASSLQPRVVAYPLPLVNYRPRVNIVRKNWNNYTQYPVLDGTSLTLYYHNDKWCLSSANGYDVSSLHWMGITYGNAFRELIDARGVDTTRIDRARNYSVLIRHHTMHPFGADPDGVWLLQVCEGSTVVNDPDDELVLKLPRQSTSSRMHTYRHIAETNSRAMDEFTKRGTVNYGYILRSNVDMGADTCVLLESTLMARIRNHAYATPHDRKTIACYEQKRYMVLRAYLNYASRGEFLKLFPQFGQCFADFGKLFDAVTDRIMNALRNKNVRTALSGIVSTTLDKIAVLVLADVESMESFNVFDSNSVSILHDIVVDGKYLNAYYTIMYAHT